MSSLIRLVIAFGCLIAPLTARSGTNSEPGKPAQEVEKVGGLYEVKQIERRPGDTFTIRFESVTKTGRYDALILESDHVHVGVELGAKVRLSAQILSETGATAEVAQVLVFLPVGQTHVPVWLLSRKAPHGDMRGTKYLEMHAPTSDYTVF